MVPSHTANPISTRLSRAAATAAVRAGVLAAYQVLRTNQTASPISTIDSIRCSATR